LRRRFKRSQASHFVEDAFRVQLAFQPLERAIYWFAFSNNDFWHQFTSIPKKNSPITSLGGANLLRRSTPRQLRQERFKMRGLAPEAFASEQDLADFEVMRSSLVFGLHNPVSTSEN
jgi:hypothetical protein